jgi:hypothetical protein
MVLWSIGKQVMHCGAVLELTDSDSSSLLPFPCFTTRGRAASCRVSPPPRSSQPSSLQDSAQTGFLQSEPTNHLHRPDDGENHWNFIRLEARRFFGLVCCNVGRTRRRNGRPGKHRVQ